MCVLSLVALLLEALSAEQLVAALYGITWPLAALGLDRARAALRLTLVLRYTAATREHTDWRRWLDEAFPPEPEDAVQLDARPLGRADWMVLLLAGLLGGWWMS